MKTPRMTPSRVKSLRKTRTIDHETKEEMLCEEKTAHSRAKKPMK